MTSKRLLNISIKFYTSPKNLYPQNKFLAMPLRNTLGPWHPGHKSTPNIDLIGRAKFRCWKADLNDRSKTQCPSGGLNNLESEAVNENVIVLPVAELTWKLSITVVNTSGVFHVFVTVIPVSEHLATVLALVAVARVFLWIAGAAPSCAVTDNHHTQQTDVHQIHTIFYETIAIISIQLHVIVTVACT